jgi:hypothetical protein
MWALCELSVLTFLELLWDESAEKVSMSSEMMGRHVLGVGKRGRTTESMCM